MHSFFQHVLCSILCVLCTGPGSLWDDCQRLSEEGSDDERLDPRVLRRVQDTGRVRFHKHGYLSAHFTYIFGNLSHHNLSILGHSKSFCCLSVCFVNIQCDLCSGV